MKRVREEDEEEETIRLVLEYKRARVEDPQLAPELPPELVVQVAWNVCNGAFFAVQGFARRDSLRCVEYAKVPVVHGFIDVLPVGYIEPETRILRQGTAWTVLSQLFRGLATMACVCKTWFAAIDWRAVGAGIRHHAVGLFPMTVALLMEPTDDQIVMYTRVCKAMTRML